MQALIIYDSLFGNTEKVARAIGEVLSAQHTTRVLRATEVNLSEASGIDLLVVGGPTHAHGMSVPMRQLLSGLEQDSLQGAEAAAFDTRIHGPRWLWGSAAVAITAELRRAGCRLVLPPESFFVGLKKQSGLRSGELERATNWARGLLTASLQSGLRSEAAG